MKLFLFLDDSSIARLLKQQIAHLRLSFKSDLSMVSAFELSKNVYARIFALGEKLMTLDFHDSEVCQPSLSFHDLPTNTCHSSTLLCLNISVSTFDDCLTLLDGRLPQLSNFRVIIRNIDQSSLSIDNTVSTLIIVLIKKTIFLNCVFYYRWSCPSLNFYH